MQRPPVNSGIIKVVVEAEVVLEVVLVVVVVSFLCVFRLSQCSWLFVPLCSTTTCSCSIVKMVDVFTCHLRAVVNSFIGHVIPLVYTVGGWGGWGGGDGGGCGGDGGGGCGG